MTEAWIMSVDWSGQEAYKNADRLVWKINPSDTEVAGYVRIVKNFYQVSNWMNACAVVKWADSDKSYLELIYVQLLSYW